MGKTKWTIAVLLAGIIITGYGGLCGKKHKRSSTDTGSSATPAQQVLSTVSEFVQQVESNNVAEAMDKMDFVDDAEKNVTQAFYSDPANKTKIDVHLAALKNVTIIEESENYMILELTSPTIGAYKIWMIKRDGQWKIAD